MERRIFGLENEYAATRGSERYKLHANPDELARVLFRKIVAWGRSSNVFLENGARFYLDVGSHPEYATPECDSISDLVAADKAGERVLEDLLGVANIRLHEENARNPRAVILKNNADSAGNSFGCHENYLTLRCRPEDRIDAGTPVGEADAKFLKEVTDGIIPFFVTRQLLCGAGSIIKSPDEMGVQAVYVMSQRAAHIWEETSSATTRSRPMINTRDEPHADADQFRRLHVIVGDSNMSEWSAFLKVGSTHLVLRMIEDGVKLPDLTLANPVRAIKLTSYRLDGRAELQLADESLKTALEMQRIYLEAAEKHFKGEGGEVAQILEMWRFVVESYTLPELDGSDPSEATIAGRLGETVDWAIKYCWLHAAMKRHDLPLDHPQILARAHEYHTVDRARSPFYKMQELGLVKRVCTDERIGELVEHPPETTRAWIRGRFVAAARADRRDYNVDWTQLKLNDGNQRKFELKDPFEHDFKKRASLLREIEDMENRVARNAAGRRPSGLDASAPTYLEQRALAAASTPPGGAGRGAVSPDTANADVYPESHSGISFGV